VNQFRNLRIRALDMRDGGLVHGDLLGRCAAPGGREYRPFALPFIMPNGSAWYTTSQVARRPG
jgi:hypothetical protein